MDLLNHSDRLPKPLRFLVICLICVLAGLIVFEHSVWTNDERKIPGVVSGRVSVFYEELSKIAHIDDIDATEQFIYIHFAQDVIAIYDWDGNYQCSLAFHRSQNGTLTMRVSDGLLYVNDRQNYTYIFQGQQLIKTLMPEESEHGYIWYQESSRTVYIHENKVFDKNGNYIMDLPGRI